MSTHATIVGMVDRVNARKVYTLEEIKSARFFPWARHQSTLRKMLDADRHGPNFLKVEITGVGKQTRYLIQGKNIKRYLKVYGPGLMSLVRNNQKHERRSKGVGEKRKARKG